MNKLKHYFCLALFLFLGIVQAQKKHLTTYKKDETFVKHFKDVKDKDTYRHAIKSLPNESRSVMNSILQKELSVFASDLINTNITIKKLLIGTILSLDSKEIIVNKTAKAFVLKNNGKSIYHLIDYGLFTTLKNEKHSFASEMKIVIEDELEAYDCKNKSIHSNVHETNLKVIKSRVIFGSNDDITNNTAIGFTNASDGAKLNVGFNFDVRKKHFFNAALVTEAEGGFLYSDGSWSNSIGAIITHNVVLGKTSQYFDKTNCKKKNIIRKDSLEKKRNSLKLQEKSYKGSIEKAKKLKQDNDSIVNQNRVLTYVELNIIKENSKIIKALTKEAKAFESIVLDVKDYINKELITFDTANNNLKGHFVKWFKTSLNIKNQSITVDSLNINPTIDPTDNLPRVTAIFSYNVSRLKNNKLLNLQGFTRVVMGNFLDAILNKSTPVLTAQNNAFFVVDNQNNIVGRYSDLKKVFWSASFGGQFSYFVTNNFGLTGSLSHNFALQRMNFVTYKNRYTALAGFAFRAQDEKDNNKITFRLLGGFEDLTYKSKTWDNASVKISLGIPFKI